MGLIKRILGKIHHCTIDMLCNLRCNTIGFTAGNTFLCITMDKVRTLFLHNVRLFLTHGAAHQVTSSHCISTQITYDLHNLLLIYDTAISRRKNRLQLWCLIRYQIRIILTLDIAWNKVHRTWSIQGNTGNDIFQILRFEFFHEVLHALTFQLEHTICLACSKGRQYLLVIIINLVHINDDSMCFFHIADCILDYGQCTQPQEIHLQKSQLFYGRHSELCRDRTITSPGKWNELICRLLADNNTCRMHGSMSWQSFQLLTHIYQIMNLLILLIQIP